MTSHMISMVAMETQHLVEELQPNVTYRFVSYTHVDCGYVFEYCQHMSVFHCSLQLCRDLANIDWLLHTHIHTHAHMHRLRVQAENEIGRGPFSSYLSASTLHPPPSPPPLSLVSCTPNSLKLAWTKKPSKGVEYTLEMAQQGRRCVHPRFPGERGQSQCCTFDI